MPETTINIIISSVLSFFTAVFSTAINAYFLSELRKEEIRLQSRLDDIAKKRELLLQHDLEYKIKALENDKISKLENSIAEILEKLNNG